MTTSASEWKEENSTSGASFEQVYERQISDALQLYVLPFIIFVGTLGNLLAFLVLLRSRMRSTSVHFYLVLLACADTTVLYVSAFKTWMRVLSGFELLHVSESCCKVVSFLILVAFHLAAWVVVLITLDRFIAVWFPLRASTMCTLRRSALAATILTAIVVAYSSHVFWTMHLSERGCVPTTTYDGLLSSTTKLVTYSLLPFVVILCLNVAIIIRLRWRAPALRAGRMSRGGGSIVGPPSLSLDGSPAASSAAVTSAGSGTAAHILGARTQLRVTYMLLAVSFTWLMLSGPFSLFSLVIQTAPSVRDAQRHGPYFIARIVVFLLYYTNHSINFFLYCITGNKFRRELADLLCCVLGQRRSGGGPGRSGVPVYSPSAKTLRSNCADAIELQEQLPLNPRPALWQD